MTAVTHPVHPIDHPTEHVVQGLDTAVEGALWSYEPLRTTRSIIGVEAQPDGTVTLRGNVVSEMMRSMAGRLAAAVPGVTSVRNELVSDAVLESRVAEILFAQPVRLSTDRLDIESRLGTVFLGGSVVSPDTDAGRAALESAVAEIRDLPGLSLVIEQVDVVAGTDELAAAAGADDEDSGPTPEQAAMEERLRVWRERAAARDG